MPEEIRLWRVGDGDQLREVASSRLDLEERLEKWLAEDISVLSSDLLVIGRQVATEYGGIIDLLCINPAGDLVIVELKRDKTPREITAQVLDYASWVRDLSHDSISHQANAYLKDRGPLEKRFPEEFGIELPEVLNSGHAMIVVGSSIDDSTERIINYLSDEYGTNINAATFRFYSDTDLGELLGRVFLIEPEAVDYKSRTKTSSKRKPNLTYEQLEAVADEKGVGNLYRHAFEGLGRVFSKGTTRTTTGFAANFDGSRNVVFNLLPFESNPEKGLFFQAYSVRLGQLTELPREKVEGALPSPVEPWAYANEPDPSWHGCTGYFQSISQIEDFTHFLHEALHLDSGGAA